MLNIFLNSIRNVTICIGCKLKSPQVFHVHERGWEKMYNMNPMDVYLKYFNHLEFKDRQAKTLFLVCFQHIYADILLAI